MKLDLQFFGGRGSSSSASGSASGSAPTPALINNSSLLKAQVQNAIENGYKSPRVNSMLKQAENAGWKETYPGYRNGVPNRSMMTKGTGTLNERQAKISVDNNNVLLYVTDGNMASEYHFSSISDAIKSGDKFVTNKKASTKKSGPKDSEFIVGSGKRR